MTLRSTVIAVSLATSAGFGAGVAVGAPTKSEVYEPLAVGHVDYVAVSPTGECEQSPDGGVAGAVFATNDAGVPTRCWRTHARVCVPSLVEGIAPACEEYRAPTDADTIPIVSGLITGRVFPGLAAKHGFAIKQESP